MLRFFCCLLVLVWFGEAEPTLAQTLTISNTKIEWKVVNRFRLFRDASLFKLHENAWRQYVSHVDALPKSADEKSEIIRTTSVLGIEHVLNDRYIPFTRLLRSNFDWRGWGARTIEQTCWDEKSQSHSACGGVESYVSPTSHAVEFKIRPIGRNQLLSEFNCEWRVTGSPSQVAPCDEPVVAEIPYPAGATVAVNVEGENGISSEVAVRDILIAGMGDSFASGEGNPDGPVALAQDKRSKNVYPARLKNDRSGDALWLDEKCHRSIYSYQLRAALQVAVENPQSAVTFLGYACSGATVEDGILGPQEYVGFVSDGKENPSVTALSGGKRDSQLYRLLSDLCSIAPQLDNGNWQCPEGKFRRTIDYLFLSIGGNDIGFSSLVAWSTLRKTVSSRIAKFLGATVSPNDFAANMKDQLPSIYAKLSRIIEDAVPVRAGSIGYDPSRIFLSAYPDILVDEGGKVCTGGDSDELNYPSNQSLDAFSSWLVVTSAKVQKAHEQLARLHQRMASLAEDHGWTFAGRAYADRPFQGHGFCAQRIGQPVELTEKLRIPCWRRSVDDESSGCETSWITGERRWVPYDPSAENYPYALRQRWVRTFNDAYMVINQKVDTKAGRIDERASSAVFSETTGAMHPTAEGQAALADALLLDLRVDVARLLESR